MKFEVKNRDVLTADDELSSDISWRIVNALKQFVAALRVHSAEPSGLRCVSERTLCGA